MKLTVVIFDLACDELVGYFRERNEDRLCSKIRDMQTIIHAKLLIEGKIEHETYRRDEITVNGNDRKAS